MTDHNEAAAPDYSKEPPVPLPDYLNDCECPLKPRIHLTSCEIATAFERIPLSGRPEYKGLGQRFTGISWSYPARVTGSIAIDVAFDPIRVVEKYADRYADFEPDSEWLPWEKPLAFLYHLIEEQLDMGGVYFGERKLCLDSSRLDELTLRWDYNEQRTDHSWTPEDTERLNAVLNPGVVPQVHPDQGALDV